MRDIDPAMQAALDGGATTHCRCWRVTRKDGLVLGFTDHDVSLSFEGTEFRASAGVDASALETSTGLSVDNGQIAGALSDEAITEDDIKAGRYDGARVDQWLVDWSAPERRLHLFRGTFGEIRRKERSFEVELRGLAEALNVPVGRTIKRTCNLVVGEAKCGVDLGRSGRFLETEADGVIDGHGIVLASAGDVAAGWFALGALRWLSGANAGLVAPVSGDRIVGGRRVVYLAEPPPLDVAAGDRLRVTVGCDRHADTCRSRFDNFLNFRGFPHIPGDDWIVAYPKAGSVHDGSSLGRG